MVDRQDRAQSSARWGRLPLVSARESGSLMFAVSLVAWACEVLRGYIAHLHATLRLRSVPYVSEMDWRVQHGFGHSEEEF